MADRPNLVFVFSDQQRFDTMACYGNRWIQTPHLNTLASKSFVFRSAYVTQPLCAPARSSILTGLYPHATGMTLNFIVLPREVLTIAEMVSEEYLCGYFGKWHLGDDVIPQHGFDAWVSTEDRHRGQYTRKEYRFRFSDYHRYLVSNGFTPDSDRHGALIFSENQCANLPPQFKMASFVGDRAADFIEENKNRPFVLYVSTFEPHSPYDGPFREQYDPGRLPVTPTFLKRPEGGSLLNKLKADYYLQYLHEGGDPSKDAYMTEYAALWEDVTTEQGWMRLRAHYFANITLVDGMMGKITNALERAGLADNTVVVFTSDHGDMLGDHGMLEKRSLYEEATRVPLLIHVPWLSLEQRDIAGAIGHIDLVPTLLNLLGQPIPGHLQGKSRASVLQGEDTLEDNDAFIQLNGIGGERRERNLGTPAINRMIALPWRSVVSGGWKLNLCVGDQCELFDLSSDPYEQTNLFDHSAQKERIRDMAARIRIWQHETGDKAPLPSV